MPKPTTSLNSSSCLARSLSGLLRKPFCDDVLDDGQYGQVYKSGSERSPGTLCRDQILSIIKEALELAEDQLDGVAGKGSLHADCDL